MTFEEWEAKTDIFMGPMERQFAEMAFAAGAASRDAEMQKCMSEISKLKDALGYDWDKYKASQEALREHMQMVQDKDAEIAELVAALKFAIAIIGHPDDGGTAYLTSVLAKWSKP